jgi:predicted DCC family thiol-disulfide oxidoreductase YuxK
VTGAPGRLVVLYDGECGFCAWGLAWLLRWDRRRRLAAVAIQSAQGARLLADLPEEHRLASWHARDPHGRRSSGGAALAPVLECLPGGRPLAALAMRFPRATESSYAWVAANRTRLGRFISAGARRRARALIAARMH